jgi:chromosome segregation ATPase
MNTVHIHFIREISRNLDRNRGVKLKTLTPSLISEIETLSTTPQAADRTIKDLETKQNDKKEAESALSIQQFRLQSAFEEEEARAKQLESSLEAARKQSAARTKELWEVKEALTAEKQQGEREAERLNKGLEGLVGEVRGLEKTVTRLKCSYAMRRVEAVQRLSDLKDVRNRENAMRLMALESLERLQREIEECEKPVAVITPCKQRPVLPRQSLTPQPRRRRYKLGKD